MDSRRWSKNLLQRFGLKRKIETYPSLEVNNKEGIMNNKDLLNLIDITVSFEGF